MNEEEELKILRELLWKIGDAQISAMKDEGTRVKEILCEISRYCYSQSNSYEGQTNEEREKLRINSLERLSKI